MTDEEREKHTRERKLRTHDRNKYLREHPLSGGDGPSGDNAGTSS
jgi:hypothetical protein